MPEASKIDKGPEKDPILGKFDKVFFDEYYNTNAAFTIIVDSLVAGVTPYEAIQNLIKANEGLIDSVTKLYFHNK